MNRVVKIITAITIIACMFFLKENNSHKLPESITWQSEYGIKNSIEFNPMTAVWRGEYGIDASRTDIGLIAVSCTSEKNLKLFIRHELSDAKHAIPNDGTSVIIPLSYGDGQYKVCVMEQVKDTQYRYAHIVKLTVKLTDPLSPYLYANNYVPYNRNSQCVKIAGELAKRSRNKEQFIENIEEYVRHNIEYDEELIPGNLSDHHINPDKTLETKKGICLDFASLITAMLRSQGIPAKLVFGYVSYDEEFYYHAWTETYTGTEWIIMDACMPSILKTQITYQPTQYF